MGITVTGGVKLPQGRFKVNVAAIIAGSRYWRLQTQGTGSEGNGHSISELKMFYDGSLKFLNSFTLTNIGGPFSETKPITHINDQITETVNDTNFGFVADSGGTQDMDFYVDFGVSNDKEVSVYSIAPQGDIGANVFNAPVAFNAYRSDNASDWTLVKSFTGITTGIGPWNPGTFRDFDLT